MNDPESLYNSQKQSKKDAKLANIVNYIRKYPELLRNEMHPFSAEK